MHRSVTNPRKSRRHLAATKGQQRVAQCLVVDAVEFEPVSARKKPDSRENSQFRRENRTKRSKKCRFFRALSEKFPRTKSGKIFVQCKESFDAIRELLHLYREYFFILQFRRKIKRCFAEKYDGSQNGRGLPMGNKD